MRIALPIALLPLALAGCVSSCGDDMTERMSMQMDATEAAEAEVLDGEFRTQQPETEPATAAQRARMTSEIAAFEDAEEEVIDGEFRTQTAGDDVALAKEIDEAEPPSADR